MTEMLVQLHDGAIHLLPALRVPNELSFGDGTLLQAAAGPNPNSYFETPNVKAPIISSAADLNEVVLAPAFEFGLPTEAGESYVLRR